MSDKGIGLGVIADDLTGGAKVASLLESFGVRCPLLMSESALDSLSGNERAVVIGRKLLAVPPEEAAADATRIANALLTKGVRQIYYKYSALFSSTSRGNIGPVAEALTSLTGTQSVLFCPARPERNATVYQGRLFLGQNMLHETPRRNDPVTPMTNSNLIEVLQSQSRVKVGLLPLEMLRADLDTARRYLAEQNASDVRFFIVDAIDADDLGHIAKLVENVALTTGSDDLPVELMRQRLDSSHISVGKSLLAPAPGYTALISGSCTPKSVRQLDRFEQRYPVFRIDLRLATDLAELVDEIVDWATKRVVNGPVGISTSTSSDVVKHLQSKMGREGASSLAEGVLGRVTKRLYEFGVRKFLVAGGETSGLVLDVLSVDRVDVAVHDELLGGYCHVGGEDPIAFVLKAGSTGDVDFYETALKRLHEADTEVN